MSKVSRQGFGQVWDPLSTHVDISAALASPPSAVEFLLPGFKVGSVGALVSPGGVGKSFWVLALCAAMSNKEIRNQFGLSAGQGSAVVLSAEEDAQVLSLRLHAQRKALSLQVSEEVLDSLWTQTSLHGLVGVALDIFDPECFDSILSLCKSSGAKLLVLDTLSRFHRLDENCSRDMALVISRLEHIAVESGASVLYLHHSSKAAGRAMQTDTPQAARGSSVLVDNARWVSFMEPMSSAQAKRFKISETDRKQYVRWNVSKQNYGPAIEDQWYVRVEGGALLAVSLKDISSGGAFHLQSSGLSERDALMVPTDTGHIIINKGKVTTDPSTSLSAKGAFGSEW